MVPNAPINVSNKLIAGGLSFGGYTPGTTVVNAGSAGSYAGSGLLGQRDLDTLLGDEESKKRKKKGGD